MARAAAEMDPVSAMRSISSALPGPIAGRRLPSTRSVKPRYLRSRIRKEELLAADPVGANRILPFAGNDPVDERPAHFALHAQVFRRVDEDDAVMVVQALVALDQNRELAAVLE